MNFSQYPTIYKNFNNYLVKSIPDTINMDAMNAYQIEVDKHKLPKKLLQEKWFTRIDPEFLTRNNISVGNYQYDNSQWTPKGQLGRE